MSILLLGLPPPTIKSLWAEHNYAQLLAPELSQCGWCLPFSLQWFIPHCVLLLSICLQSVAYTCLVSVLYFVDNFITKSKVRAVKPQSVASVFRRLFSEVFRSHHRFPKILSWCYIFLFLFPIKMLVKFSHLYRASWYYQSFIYSPADTLVSCLKNNIKIYIKIYINPLNTELNPICQ
jgi:hypothetical protein